jgi:hypothetical protein
LAEPKDDATENSTAGDRQKPDPTEDPTFRRVVRTFLNTPHKPHKPAKGDAAKKRDERPTKGESGGR